MKAIEPKRYDGRSFGCDCSNCPLDGSIVVPPTINKKPLAIILAECPGATEEIKLEPLVGESGQLMDRVLDRCGSDRSEFHLTNVLLCKAPRALTPAQWKQAKKCCRPRLEQELQDVRTWSIIAFGKHALEATTGKSKITEYMGAPLQGTGFFEQCQILPMYHPAMAHREPHWIPVLARHLSRGVLMARGQLPAWKWPLIEIEGRGLTAALHGILASKQLIAVDIENVSLEPVADPEFRLLNVGFAIKNLACSVQWDSATTEQKRLAAAILADKEIWKVCHNGQHDYLGLLRAGLPMEDYVFDTIYGASVISPQLPRRLDILTCIEFHAPRWKTEFRATKDESSTNRFIHADPTERAIYNARDAWMTLLLWRAQEKQLEQVHNGGAMFQQYMRLNTLAIIMRRNGFRTNLAQLDTHKRILGRRMRDARRSLQRAAYDFKLKLLKNGELVMFNPSSNAHINSLFVDGLGVVPTAFSEKTQNAKWDEKVLTKLAANASSEVRKAARLLLKFRRNSKYLSSFVLPLEGRPRIHATPNPGGTIVGRWSYQNPSLQVIPKPEYKKLKNGKEVVAVPGMRDLYRADKGMWLVEADYKQLQAYILAVISNDTKMLEMLKGDIHTATANMLCELMKVERSSLGEKEAKRLRELCKKARYQWQFGSTPENAWKVLVVEIPDLALSQLERLWQILDKIHPQAVAWRREQKNFAFKNDYVEAPISGRRYHFHGKVEVTKCYNLPIIMSEADEMNPAILRVASKLVAGEAIIAQVHDSILAQGPDKLRLATMMKEEMERSGTFKVDIKASRRRGGDWGSLEELTI